MNTKFQDRYRLSDDDWQDYLKIQKLERQRELDEIYAEGEPFSPRTQAAMQFYDTGELLPFLKSAEEFKYQVGWKEVLSTNPYRDFQRLYSNAETYWNWVLEDSDARIPHHPIDEERTIDGYFWDGFDGLHHGGIIRDPFLAVPLFKDIYGHKYQQYIEFPKSFGGGSWKPTLKLDGSRLFNQFIESIELYLFGDHSAYRVCRGTIVAHIDYWLSMFTCEGFDHLGEAGYSTLFYDEDFAAKRNDPYTNEFMRRQRWVRRLFSGLLGYVNDVDDQNVSNDPEVADYIWTRIQQIEMPDEFHRLIDFLHRHKHDALEASEGEPAPNTPYFKDPNSIELYEMNDLIADVQKFCEQHGYEIEEALWKHLQNVDRYEMSELDEGLYEVFQAYGKIGYAETGEPPESFLPTYIKTFLKLTKTDSWVLDSVVSTDNWDNAEVTLKNKDGNETYDFIVTGIGGSDMVPQSLFDRLNEFSSIHGTHMLRIMYSDDAFLMVPMTNTHYSRLQYALRI